MWVSLSSNPRICGPGLGAGVGGLIPTPVNTAPVATPAAVSMSAVTTGCVVVAVLLDVGVVGVGGASVVEIVVAVAGGERVRRSSDISAISSTLSLSVSLCGRAVWDDAEGEGAREKRGTPRSGCRDGGRR